MGLGRSSYSAGALSAAEVGQIYREHRAELVRVASRWVRDPHKAEEIVQDALIKVILAAPEIQSGEHARNYLKKSVQTQSVDYLRAEGLKPTLVAIDEDEAMASLLVSNTPDHLDALAVVEDAAIIRQALSLLSPSERAALVMLEIDGRSKADIANELGIKESSVKHTLARARASLRRILSELVVDEKRGLTALELLSRSYSFSKEVAKKSTKAALSLVLILAAVIGVKQLPQQLPSSGNALAEVQSGGNSDLSAKVNGSIEPKAQKSLSSEAGTEASSPRIKLANAKATRVSFPGLDSQGVPSGFTIADSSGKFGTLFASFKTATVSEDSIISSGIVKTSASGPNLLLNQVVTHSIEGVTFDGSLAFASEGKWIPANFNVLSTEIERLSTGKYLLSVALQVKSAVETPISIPASAGGWDLSSLPARVVIRTLLSADKMEVIAEAIQVIEKASR